jgi:hypothetical protein
VVDGAGAPGDARRGPMPAGRQGHPWVRGAAGGRSPPQLSYPVGTVPPNSDPFTGGRAGWAGRRW